MGRTKGTFGGSLPKGGSMFTKGGKINRKKLIKLENLQSNKFED